ncbi:MAG: hypothetical protein SGI92_03700, partial [Bryobacteraceae bacterium]|nr:hypothetical protein [Bryobacteraceae bacterium]
CQVGAEERGKAGASYDAILAAYYPGTTAGIAASGLRWRRGRGERVDLFASTDAELRELSPVADRAIGEAERLTGLRVAARPRVRAYPTLPVYRDATGDGGSVAGTTSGLLIRLQPLSALRSRGALHSTLLHEMLHVLIEANARPDIPVWFREGLAQHLGGSTRSPRVTALARRYGAAVLLGWLRTGLPQAAAQSGRTR